MWMNNTFLGVLENVLDYITIEDNLRLLPPDDTLHFYNGRSTPVPEMVETVTEIIISGHLPGTMLPHLPDVLVESL